MTAQQKKMAAKAKAKPARAAAPARQRAGAGKKKQTTAVAVRRVADNHPMAPNHPGLIPSLTYQGEAFPLKGITRFELFVPTSDRVLMFITNTGVSGSIMQRLQWDAAGPDTALVDSKVNYTIPTLTLDDASGGPTSMRAMKAGVSLVNRTQFLNRGGLVYVLNTSQRLRAGALPSAMTRAQASALFSTISGHPHTHAMDWADFGHPRQSYCHVVDDPRYNDFDENKGVLSADEFFQHIGLGGASTPLDRPMSTIVIACERPPIVQSVQVTASAAFYTRWPLDSVPGQSQTKIPTTTPDKHNAVHKSASQHAKLPPTFVDDMEKAAETFGKDVVDVVGDFAKASRRAPRR